MHTQRKFVFNLGNTNTSKIQTNNLELKLLTQNSREMKVEEEKIYIQYYKHCVHILQSIKPYLWLALGHLEMAAAEGEKHC